MSWFGFHALGQWLLLLLVVPLVLFYFLKLKRQRERVPSLFLWRQVLDDRRVNSPFQRFKRNLLLLLQLLVLLLACLAALQPFWRGRSAGIRRLPILIDCSASMAALDRAGGRSRLDAAKAKASRLIDEMLPNQEYCLISFSRTARRRTGFTNDKRVLRRALDGIEIEEVPSNVADALHMAQALARSSSFEDVFLYSDGNFPAQADLELSFKLEYQRLEPAGPNVGITAFNATRSGDGHWNVFLSVEGTARTDASATVTVTHDGEAVTTDRLVITKGSAARMTFQVESDSPASLQATLATKDFDALANDNVAYLDLPVARSLWAYAPLSLPAFRHALRALRTVKLFPDDAGQAGETRYDLVITDDEDDLGLEATTRLCVGFLPLDVRTLATEEDKSTRVTDWRRNEPVLQHVELADLILLDRVRSNAGVTDADYERLAYDILIHGDLGPLMLRRQRGEQVTYCLLFHSNRSTLPYRIGFPILVTNLVQATMDRAGLAKAQGAHTGILPRLTLARDRAYQVRGPGIEPRAERTDAHGLLAGIPAPRVGVYRIREGSAERRRIGASLLSPRETRLAGVDEIRFSEGLAVAAAAQPPRTDRSLWWTLALVGLGVMLFEWWYFQRRPGGFAR